MTIFNKHMPRKLISQIITYVYRSPLSYRHPIYRSGENQEVQKKIPSIFPPTSRPLYKTNHLSRESAVSLQPVKPLYALSLSYRSVSSPPYDCAKHKLFHFLSSYAVKSLVNSILSNFTPLHTQLLFISFCLVFSSFNPCLII